MTRKDTNILVVDSTGRGHAICDLFVRTDPDVTVFYGPGNNAISHDRIISVAEISLCDVQTVIDFCRRVPVEFVFVSYIQSLAAGFVDALRAHGIPAIGPTRAGAQLEASKRRAKRFCFDHDIPTGQFQWFDDPGLAKAYIRSLAIPVAVKVDGLCLVGDGAHVCETAQQAEAAVDEIAAASQAAGEAFAVVVEERLFGHEISIFALLDGRDYVLFPTALDFKRALDGNRGKNCDGMGSIAPHPGDSPEMRQQIRKTIMDPLCKGLRAEGIEFTGFIYAGAMMTDKGLQIIEINARFGDSEAEVVLPSVHSNFTDTCRRVLKQNLRHARLAVDGLSRCCVVATQGNIAPQDPAAKPGWPFGDFAAGQPVHGVDSIDRDRAQVFFAGATVADSNTLVTTDGRVLHVVGRSPFPEQAVINAYAQIECIHFPGMRYRSDIGRAVANTGSRRRTWWGQIQWTRCMHQAIATAFVPPISPLSGIWPGQGRDSEWVADSAIMGFFAGEQQIDEVLDLFTALGYTNSDTDVVLVSLLAQVLKALVARAETETAYRASEAIAGELVQICCSLRAHLGHSRTSSPQLPSEGDEVHIASAVGCQLSGYRSGFLAMVRASEFAGFVPCSAKEYGDWKVTLLAEIAHFFARSGESQQIADLQSPQSPQRPQRPQSPQRPQRPQSPQRSQSPQSPQRQTGDVAQNSLPTAEFHVG